MAGASPGWAGSDQYPGVDPALKHLHPAVPASRIILPSVSF